jgi:hypothetical protein
MLWHWRNDLARLPDDDHMRCMAAAGVRELVYRGQLFEMTTVFVGRRARLQMEHVGVSSEHAEVARYWRSQPFDGESPGGMAQYAAGLDLLATVATELAAGVQAA